MKLSAKWILSICLVGVTTVFLLLLRYQSDSLNPTSILRRLVNEKKIREIPRWRAELFDCTAKSCELLSKDITYVTIPGRPELQELVRKLAKPPTLVQLTYEFDADDRSWIAQSEVVVISASRSVHRSTYLNTPSPMQSAFGYGANVSFSVYTKDLLASGRIVLQIDFMAHDSFGPVIFPISLVQVDAQRTFETLPTILDSSAHLGKQLEIALPLTLVCMAIVLDHSIAFWLLALLATARALRSYAYFRLNLGADAEVFLTHLAFFTNGLVLGLLLVFLAEMASIAVSQRRRFVLAATTSLVFYLGQFVDPLFLLRADGIADGLGASIGIPLLAWGTYRKFWKQRETAPPLSQEDIPDAAGAAATWLAVSKALYLGRNLLIAAALFASAWANAQDLLGLAASEAKAFISWQHAVLFPALIIATLMEVGSTARKMQEVGAIMVDKALTDRELEVGKEIQEHMLPPRRGRVAGFEWRAFYFRASKLGGDWFDVREVSFRDGKRCMVACVTDVTGHGVGAALITSTLSSHWGLWCASLEKMDWPDDEAARYQILADAPRRMHEGLCALRRNDGCTGVLVLVDVEERRVYLTTPSHPGILMGQNDLKYLSAPGARIGFASDNPSWQCSSVEIGPNEPIFLYSDGLVPPGEQISRWAQHLKQAIRAGQGTLLGHLVRQMRRNRSTFRRQRSIEDDITLLIIRPRTSEASMPTAPRIAG